MALVAYSDESDFSDDDDESPKINTEKLNNQAGEEKIDKQNGNVQHFPEIIKEMGEPSEVGDDEDDDVNDVPTVQTWNVLKNKEPSSNIGQIFKKDPKSKKLKLVLPALSEFDDEDDDEDNKDEDLKRKKIQPSSSGTGLFAVLPKPKCGGSVTSLVPLHVSKKIANKTNSSKKKVKPQKLSSSTCESDEEWDTNTTNDFFSLEKSESSPPVEPKLEPEVNVKFKFDISQEVSAPIIQEVSAPSISEQTNYIVEQEVNDHSAFLNNDVPAENSMIYTASKPEIDTRALRRLAGRRNEREIQNIIDIKADDALMSRDEWVNRTLTDEKPKTSFSRKKEGIPTQQQRRKHQITYLAHQAQEREHELQNSWGQNRFTKLQTQSKYGF